VPAPFIVHRLDPIIATVYGAHLWWYGLSYTLGFLNAHLFLRRNRRQLGLSLRSVYGLTLCLAAGVLAGGRALVVFDHEWVYYREHLSQIPAMWLGGMATHGLLAAGSSACSPTASRAASRSGRCSTRSPFRRRSSWASGASAISSTVRSSVA
jgi:prolipoprotein diacylglyceryltransferase